VPVVAFYLLLDWDRMVAGSTILLPRDHAPIIRDLAGQIDRTLASFVRGQGTVCLILGTFYAVALMVIGLQFGLVVGSLPGFDLHSLRGRAGGRGAVGRPRAVPVLGGMVVDPRRGGGVPGGQLVEGNILTPKLVGSSVGLHPVWLIFALSAFGSMFGFVGHARRCAGGRGDRRSGALTRIERYREGRSTGGVEAAGTPGAGPRGPLGRAGGLMAEQLVFDLPVRPAMGRDDFFVTGSNAGALAQVDGWRDWPFGKLVLVGPEGAGKTHLAHVWAAAKRGADHHGTRGDEAEIVRHGRGAGRRGRGPRGGRPGGGDAAFPPAQRVGAAGAPVLFTARAARRDGA
jgi:hypothetical protein